jgi:hypothetical protein
MEYEKPELTLMGRAHDVIQSGMFKGSVPWDSINGEPELTNASAYQADE